MPPFFLALIAVFLADAGARDQRLVAALAARLGASGGLLVTGWIASAATAAIAAAAGAGIAGLMPPAGKAMFVALALLLAAVELAWPPRRREPAEPTRSLFAALLVIASHQVSDGARFLIVALAAATGAPLLAGAGGAIGGGAALTLGWALGADLTRRVPLRAVRLAIAAALLAAAIVVGLEARGVVQGFMAKTIILPGIDDAGIARWLHQRLSEALEETGGEVAITVPGGSTPFPILAELGGMELDWPRLAVWPGDDRLVPEDHPASNVGKIRALLEPRGVCVVALTENAAPPHFALAWLGMGNDGHVASLFPNTKPRADDALRVRRITPDPLPPEAPFDRFSLTIPALLDSDELVFVIRGEGKRALFEQGMAGGNDLPVARLLRAAKQPVTCFT